MGYYTSHSLTVWTGSHTVAEIAQAIYDETYRTFHGIETPKEDMLEDTCTNTSFYLCSSDMVKWYDCESDMIEFSKRFPNALFEIAGSGEEQGDVWECRFKDGRMQSRRQIYHWNRKWTDDFKVDFLVGR